MIDEPISDASETSPLENPSVPVSPGKYLVCVNDSDVSRVALRFACIKAAKRGGLVEMLHVVQPADFQSLMGVADRIREEAMQHGEQLLAEMRAQAEPLMGTPPMASLREGMIGEEVVKAVESDHSVNMLVLGVTPGASRGKLIAWLASQLGDQLLIPVMLVPGNLTDLQIEELS